jgi:hypothetical protein
MVVAGGSGGENGRWMYRKDRKYALYRKDNQVTRAATGSSRH